MPDDRQEHGAAGRRPQAHVTPGWVKVFGLIAIAAIVLIGVMLAAGHGPGRHFPEGPAATDTGGRG